MSHFGRGQLAVAEYVNATVALAVFEHLGDAVISGRVIDVATENFVRLDYLKTFLCDVSNDFIVDSLRVGVPTACRVNEDCFSIFKHIAFFNEIICHSVNEVKHIGTMFGLKFRTAGAFALIRSFHLPEKTVGICRV